jgi:acyl-CoA reductase-like NAD-dependent aldehyde dehydrogenase
MEKYLTAHSSKEDVALAVDKAMKHFKHGEKLPTERSILLNKIAQVIEII